MTAVTLSKVLMEQIIEPTLLDSGPTERFIYGHVPWERYTYEILDVPGLESFERLHALPPNRHAISHGGGAGTFESPSGNEPLVAMLRSSGNVLLAREFALNRPHKSLENRDVIQIGGAVYYRANPATDDDEHLKKVVRCATSWKFFGILVTGELVTLSQNVLSPPQILSMAIGFVFSIYKGDSFLVARAPAFLT